MTETIINSRAVVATTIAESFWFEFVEANSIQLYAGVFRIVRLSRMFVKFYHYLLLPKYRY